MSRIDSQSRVLLSAGLLTGVLFFAGCKADHPDEKQAVLNSLSRNSLYSVMVAQDRREGLMTLTGDVASIDAKAQAESFARQAAPDYTIANNLRVISVGPAGLDATNAFDSDIAIERRFQDEVKSDKDLSNEGIVCHAKNGTLTISGTVRTAEQKRRVEVLARNVPTVQNVVNDVEIGKR
jgi:hyperosmotically inducible protein